MKSDNFQKLDISISREHEKFLPEIEAAFDGFEVHYVGGLMRFSAEELAMQVTIFLTKFFVGNIAWDLLKVGIKKIYKKFPKAYVTVRGNDSIMYTVRPDMTVNVIVTPDRWKEFEKIKSFDDLVSYLQPSNVPTGWRRAKLGEIFEFKNGVNSEGGNFGSGIRFINIMEVINNDFLGAYNIPGRITLDQKNIDNNLVKYGDVLFNRTSETPEEVGITSVYLDDEPVVFGGFVIRAREKKKVLSDEYKKYCFSSEKIRKEIVRRCQGVVRGNIGQKDLEKVPFTFPPLSEQRRIVSVLETWDQVIEKLAEKINVKKNIKEGLMQELLTGKVRLHGFADKWKTIKLGEIGKFTGGSGFPEKYQGHKSGDLPFFKVSDMNNNGNAVYMISSNNWINQEIRNSIKATVFPAKTIVIAKIGAALFLERKRILIQDSCIDNNMMGFIVIGGHPKFLFYKFLNIRFSEYANTTALPSLSGSELSEIEIRIPQSEEEQISIVELLETADKEVEALENKLAALKNQKRYLLNNLITGALRTPEK